MRITLRYATSARKRSLLNRRLRKVEAIARLHRAHRIKRFHNREPRIDEAEKRAWFLGEAAKS